VNLLSAILGFFSLFHDGMFINLVRVSSGFIGFLAFISGMTPTFHLTIMVPPDESNT
jgi:hypothetical protein